MKKYEKLIIYLIGKEIANKKIFKNKNKKTTTKKDNTQYKKQVLKKIF